MLNNKPFSLYINIFGFDDDDKYIHIPSLNMEMILSKVTEHLEPFTDDKMLHMILNEITKTNGDLQIELGQIRILIFELSAKDLYHPKRIRLEP